MNSKGKPAPVETPQRRDLQRVVHGILRQSRHAAIASSATALLLAVGETYAQQATSVSGSRVA